MTVNTRSLDKMRPDALRKDRDIDGYFRELERILAKIATTSANENATEELTNLVYSIVGKPSPQNNAALVGAINNLTNMVMSTALPAANMTQRIQQLEAEVMSLRQQINSGKQQPQISDITAYTFGAR